jgi:hypothetical protein
MRFVLDALTARRLGLDLSTDEHKRSFTIENISGAGGTVTRDENTLHMRPAQVKQLQVSGLEWSFPRGRVATNTPATVAGFAADLEVDSRRKDNPIEGEANLEALTCEDLTFELDKTRLSSDLRVQRVHVEGNTAEGGRAVLGALESTNLQLSIGSVFIRAEALGAKSMRSTWPGLVTEAGELAARGLSIQTRNLRIDIDRIELAQGIAFSDNVLRIGKVAAGEVTLVIEDLLGWQKDEGPNLPEAPTPKPRRKGPPLFDMRVLDQLSGNVDVDLTVDATVPVIGSRHATHHFRIPIDHGTINYKQLEGDLSTLEDAFIDFALRDGKLVLERDVPIIPGLNKPILTWELSDVELALARKKIVRLRRLPNFKAAEPKRRSAEHDEPAVSLRRLDFKNLQVAVGLLARSAEAEEAEPFESAFRRSVVGALEVAGTVKHHKTKELEPTELMAKASSVATEINRLPIGGGAHLDIGVVSLDTIDEGILGFQGLRPKRLELVGRGLQATNLEIHFRQRIT